MIKIHNLGFPRIGAQRELKFALERYWRGEDSLEALEHTARSLRQRHWLAQKAAGLDWVPVGDFASYDHVLNTLFLLGALPARFGIDPAHATQADPFILARGSATQPALEMTKWFDTNYHYLVPELDAQTRFDGGVEWLFDEVADAQAIGYRVKVALPGPLTFLWQSKSKDAGFDKLGLIARLLPTYARILQRLAEQGVEWVQIDEPILGLELPPEWRAAFIPVYRELAKYEPKLLLATYFGQLQENAYLAANLPVAGLHVDAINDREGVQPLINHDIQEVRELAGQGMSGRIGTRLLRLGSARFCGVDAAQGTTDSLQANLADDDGWIEDYESTEAAQ